jgi:hypothetical protein
MGLGVRRLFLDRNQEMSNEHWSALMRSATQHYRVIGVANHGYVRPGNVAASKEAFRTILERKVPVEIIWLNPASDLMRRREAEEQRTTGRDAIDAILWFWDFRANLKPALQKRLTLMCYDALPTCGITWVDDFFIVTHYLAYENDKTCPGLFLTLDSGARRALRTLAIDDFPQIAERYKTTYSEIAAKAKKIDEQDLAKFKKLLPTLPLGISEAQL